MEFFLSTFSEIYTNYWSDSLFVELYNVITANATWFEQNKNIFNFKNVALFLRTFVT